VLLASPFALFPPAHGGARRVAELVQRLANDVDFILLGDERSLYGDASETWFAPLLATHLVEGRGDRAGETAPTLDVRMTRCAWRGMRDKLAQLIERYAPDIVQVEFMELAQLAQERRAPQRWVLALHDVYLSGKPEAAATDATQQAALARFDALTACSGEDAALLPPQLTATLIGNGAIDRRAQYVPSPDTPRLLFMGPFRYAPNLQGLLEFLDTAWPLLRAQYPELQLTVLGGEESAAISANEPRLRQAGVELISRFVDPAPHLAGCTLTINPQREIRGSSIKLIESLLAGRVCVSTADGARGFSDAGMHGLVIADSIAAMGTPILALLGDAASRHARERADDAILDGFTWDAMAAKQLALYRQLLATAR
jgi:glycosyltransferase involved in cell wall biosynthesis